MSLFTKSLDALEELDLQALVADQVSEGKTLDYKEKLPGYGDDDRKEYLYDVSSFTNAAGGFLIYGMKEEAGLPTELVGISIADVDKEKLRLESMIQDGIQPRMSLSSILWK
jgi:predicted HTH transcriptional regulator